jgi:hypothetical protein
MLPVFALEDNDGAFDAGADGCSLSRAIFFLFSASSFATYVEFRRYEGIKKELELWTPTPMPGRPLNFLEYDGREAGFRQEMPAPVLKSWSWVDCLL